MATNLSNKTIVTNVIFWQYLIGIMMLCVVTESLAIANQLESVVTSIKPIDSHITTIGRLEKNADGSVRFGYPGVSFYINFTGKQLSVDAISTSDQSYLEVVVDHGGPHLIKLSSLLRTYSLLNEVVAKPHHIEILHRSETWHGIITIKQFATDGKLTAATPLPMRKILILGDSVTCGEAIERTPNETKNTRWWNPRLSYGMLIAKKLNTQLQLVCMGGHGLIRTWDGKTDELNLPEFYQLAIADQQHPVRWDQSRYDPDLIISAIGTNDFSQDIPSREIYVTAYAKFLSTLFADHPHAQILLTEGAILGGDKKAAIIDYIDESIKRVGDRHIHHATTTHFTGDEIDAHPTKAQHAEIAAELLPQIRKIMSW